MPAAADGKVVMCQMFCETTMTQMGAEQDRFDADRLFQLMSTYCAVLAQLHSCWRVRLCLQCSMGGCTRLSQCQQDPLQLTKSAVACCLACRPEGERQTSLHDRCTAELSDGTLCRLACVLCCNAD